VKLTNSLEQSPLEKLIVAYPIEKFPVFYGNLRLITVLTRLLHFVLSRTKEYIRWPFPEPNNSSDGPIKRQGIHPVALSRGK
jgi:hypothetical protein